MDVLETSFLYLLEQLVLALRPERVVALQHHVEQDPQRPHVCVNRTMVHLGNDLGGHIGRCAAESIDSLILLASETEAEVDELKLPMPVDQYVLGLDITMNDL